jgi:hypothetical protein
MADDRTHQLSDRPAHEPGAMAAALRTAAANAGDSELALLLLNAAEDLDAADAERDTALARSDELQGRVSLLRGLLLEVRNQARSDAIDLAERIGRALRATPPSDDANPVLSEISEG